MYCCFFTVVVKKDLTIYIGFNFYIIKPAILNRCVDLYSHYMHVYMYTIKLIIVMLFQQVWR